MADNPLRSLLRFSSFNFSWMSPYVGWILGVSQKAQTHCASEVVAAIDGLLTVPQGDVTGPSVAFDPVEEEDPAPTLDGL